MNFEKDLQFWVENMQTKRLRVEDIMLRQIDLSLYKCFHKENGTEQETSPFKTGRGWLYRFRKRFNLKKFEIIEQATSADEEAAATFQTELKNYQGGEIKILVMFSTVTKQVCLEENSQHNLYSQNCKTVVRI
jgi:hypothetical protein